MPTEEKLKDNEYIYPPKDAWFGDGVMVEKPNLAIERLKEGNNGDTNF